MSKKSALGKGIASLIQANSTTSFMASSFENQILIEEKPEISLKKKEMSEENVPYLVNIAQIKENQFQPRKVFNEENLLELSQSIKENGIIQPLIVVKAEVGFELIAGERRLRAAKMAGLQQVPVIIRRATDREKLILAIIENVQRADLNCVEEALAYFQLMEDFKLTQEEVAKKIGKERSTVANFLRILKLPRAVIELLKNDQLSFGHAKVLASIKDDELIKSLADKVVRETLSVRDLEHLINEQNKTKPLSKNNQKNNQNPMMENLNILKQNLERKTGFHIDLKMKNSGTGDIIIKFNNKKEFNDVYDFLIKH